MNDAEIHGLLILDKPVGISSRAAPDPAARWVSRRTRIGHAGTLDPLAGGVLVLCLGQATRLTEYVQAMPKVYRTQFVLGARSATDDAEGPVSVTDDVAVPSPATVECALAAFHG